MQKWEYLYIEIQLGGIFIEKVISNGTTTFDIKGKDKATRMMQLHEHYNKLGREGWELVAGYFASEHRQSHIFKRPIE